MSKHQKKIPWDFFFFQERSRETYEQSKNWINMEIS